MNTPPRGLATTQPSTGSRQAAERGPISDLAAMVDDMVERLERPLDGEAARQLIPECNAALETCLELLRDPGDRDQLVRNARDDLRRFARLLKLVDGPDVPFVLRQIRRILGRLDACGIASVIGRD